MEEFFEPRSLIISQTLNYSRKNKVNINEISFKIEILNEGASGGPKSVAAKGEQRSDFSIQGIYLEGARFDVNKQILCEPSPLELI